MSIKNALRELLNNLDEVDAKYPGIIHDTIVRELLNDTIVELFVFDSPMDDNQNNYYAMGTDEGDEAVHKALIQFLTHPEIKVVQVQLTSPQARLDAFQNMEVESAKGSHYDYFFGWLDGLPRRA